MTLRELVESIESGAWVILSTWSGIDPAYRFPIASMGRKLEGVYGPYTEERAALLKKLGAVEKSGMLKLEPDQTDKIQTFTDAHKAWLDTEIDLKIKVKIPYSAITECPLSSAQEATLGWVVELPNDEIEEFDFSKPNEKAEGATA